MLRLSILVVLLALCGAMARADAQGAARLGAIGWSEDGAAALFSYEEERAGQRLSGFRILSLRSAQRVEAVLSARSADGGEQLSVADCQRALTRLAKSLKAHGFGGVKTYRGACSAQRERVLRSPKRMADAFETSLEAGSKALARWCSPEGLRLEARPPLPAQQFAWPGAPLDCRKLRLAVGAQGRSLLVLGWESGITSVVLALYAPAESSSHAVVRFEPAPR